MMTDDRPSEYQLGFTGPEDEYPLGLGSVIAQRIFMISVLPKRDTRMLLKPSSGVTKYTWSELLEYTPAEPTHEYLLKGLWDQFWGPGENVATCLHYSYSNQSMDALRKLAQRFGHMDLTMRELEDLLGVHVKTAAGQWGKLHPEYRFIRPLRPVVDMRGNSAFMWLNPCTGTGKKFADCTCGFYGAYRLEYHPSLQAVCAVVEHYGKTLIGDKGVRSTKAKIKAVALQTERGVETFDGDIRLYIEGLYNSYPGIDVLWGSNARMEMFEKYPSTRP